MEQKIDGTVVKSTGSWYNVLLDNGQLLPCRIIGKFRLDGLRLTNPVAVGDRVQIFKESETAGIIKKILERRNYVVRSSPRKKMYLHLLAANIDQAVVVSTIVKPKLKQGFIDRFLLMTEPYNIPCIVLFNKSDLYNDEDLEIYEYLKAVYENIGYKVLLVSGLKGDGVSELVGLLKDKITLISGHSGVGKSTLINAFQPQLQLETKAISDYSGKGQHTTTFAEMYPLDFGGKIIDTPGIKSLAFINMEPQDVAHNFREFFILSKECKFSNCLHLNEPKCAVKIALENEEISFLRYQNYQAIINEINEQNYWERNKEMG